MKHRSSFAPQLTTASLLALAALAVGCGPAETETDPEDTPTEGILSLNPGWNSIEPGGDTVCARGTPYKYFVRPGKINKLVIEFRGGGACWNDLTCGFAESLFQEDADPDSWVVEEDKASGIYDHKRDDNPFKDWHHVYIPYCTGDIHWGNNTMTYGEGADQYTIEHKGAVNVQTVLDWTYKNVEAPEQVMVTGCSAGAYGSIMWSSHVRHHYEKAKVLQLADSGAGVITDTFFQDSFPSWKPESSYPTWIEGLKPEDLTALPQLYQAIGGAYPDMVLSQYNTQFDEDQSFYFTAMGGGPTTEWSKEMNENVQEIIDTTPNFASYLAGGYKHCIIPLDDFYTVESGGVKLVDWVNQMIAGEQPENVACQGDECGAPK
jgi:hypothetical protein